MRVGKSPPQIWGRQSDVAVKLEGCDDELAEGGIDALK